MKEATKRGLSFGVTSGVITTIGLMIGIYSSTGSKLAVLGGIITIAITDALSDSFGVNISEEATEKKRKKIWANTVSTFIFKFLSAIIFIGAILIFELKTGVIINVFLGALVLIILSYILAKKERKKPLKIIGWHLVIAALVIIMTYFLGKLIANLGLI